MEITRRLEQLMRSAVHPGERAAVMGLNTLGRHRRAPGLQRRPLLLGEERTKAPIRSLAEVIKPRAFVLALAAGTQGGGSKGPDGGWGSEWRPDFAAIRRGDARLEAVLRRVEEMHGQERFVADGDGLLEAAPPRPREKTTAAATVSNGEADGEGGHGIYGGMAAAALRQAGENEAGTVTTSLAKKRKRAASPSPGTERDAAAPRKTGTGRGAAAPSGTGTGRGAAVDIPLDYHYELA
eukprot:gene10903-23357_t